MQNVHKYLKLKNRLTALSPTSRIDDRIAELRNPLNFSPSIDVYNSIFVAEDKLKDIRILQNVLDQALSGLTTYRAITDAAKAKGRDAIKTEVDNAIDQIKAARDNAENITKTINARIAEKQKI